MAFVEILHFPLAGSVLHRDIGPGNVMWYWGEGNPLIGVLKISSLATARGPEGNERTRTQCRAWRLIFSPKKVDEAKSNIYIVTISNRSCGSRLDLFPLQGWTTLFTEIPSFRPVGNCTRSRM
jgi:hypothetical protein